ncbi:unnamed protein product [Trichogramma brassicae]|uniref:Uncharacterized protein n=1 Tax=Trichogramma brassicae TaxID=86971 RepID=A0A6H5J7H1_9HYME|nr:unnamed protein product [Trichogramma brassicae]
MCKSVDPSSSVVFGSAPRLSSHSTASSRPWTRAKCSGVLPDSSLASTLHLDVHSLSSKIDIFDDNEWTSRWRVDARDESGRTPLHLALVHGRLDAVEWLLRRGADPNTTDEDGSTLLHILSQRSSDINLVKTFFEICEKTGRPLQVDARDNWRRTPLHLALTYDRIKMAEVLLRRDADPSLTTNEGSTPLHIICQKKKDHHSAKILFEVCDELRKSIDVNAQDISYRTPLSLALMYGDEELVELLLRRGAYPNTVDDDGLTVLHLICRREYDIEMAKLLFGIADEKNRLVQVNRKDKWARTPLQYAVANVYPEMIDILLDRGTDTSSLIFPSADEFERYFEGESLRQYRDIEFELVMPLILEWLKKRGYQLDRRGAFTIIRILAYMSVHAEKYWSLVDYPVNEELCRAAVERVKKYSHEPTPRRPHPYPRRNLYETMDMKIRRTQESMIRDPWIIYGPPNLYTEEWINPVPWNYYGPPHLCTRSENNPEHWNFYESLRVSSSAEQFGIGQRIGRDAKADYSTSCCQSVSYSESDSEESDEEYRAKQHLHETPMWRGFLLRWAVQSVAELTRRLLPKSCCERIAERLTNVDLLNVCVAGKFPEWRADRRTRDRYAFRRMSVWRRQAWHDRSSHEDIRYPPLWRPEAYNRYYRNKKFIGRNALHSREFATLYVYIRIRELYRAIYHIAAARGGRKIRCARCHELEKFENNRARAGEGGRLGPAHLQLRPRGRPALHDKVVLRGRGILSLRAEEGSALRHLPRAQHTSQRLGLQCPGRDAAGPEARPLGPLQVRGVGGSAALRHQAPGGRRAGGRRAGARAEDSRGQAASGRRRHAQGQLHLGRVAARGKHHLERQRKAREYISSKRGL